MKTRRTAIAAQTVAMAIIAAAVIIGASILATSYLGTATTVTLTSTELCEQQEGNATSAHITNCSLGITLTLGVGNATISAGSNETMLLSLHNDLATNNSVYFEGGTLPPHLNSSNPAVAMEVLPPYRCGQSAWIVVYNESGLPVPINDAIPVVEICGSTSGGIPFQFTANDTVTQSFSLRGQWRSTNATAPWEGATYSQFSPGSYTALAYDPWTQPVTLNFTVE